MKQKILITGGNGFVGKHLQAALQARQIPYIVFSKRECNLTDPAQTEKMFVQHTDATSIIHLACFQAAADFPAKHPGEQFLINNLIHLNVLESWRKYLPQANLVAVGSSCAYPSALTDLSEDHFFDGAIHGSVYSYAFTKRLLYTGILAYNDQYHLNGSYLIPATMYGEYDDFHVQTAHVPGALIGKFVRAAKENLPSVEIWGDGTQVRELLYVDDFVRVLLELSPNLDRDIVNIGTGKGTAIAQLARMISQAAQYKGELEFNQSGYVGVKEKFMNVSKLQNKYHITLTDAHQDSIQRTVTWYKQHYTELKDKLKFG